MTKVREIREIIEETLAGKSNLTTRLKRDIKGFLTELARHDPKDISELLRAMSQISADTTVATAALSSFETDCIRQLADAMYDTQQFMSLVEDLLEDSRISRDGLNRIYNTLFGKTRKIPSKATRASLVRDIIDSRVSKARSANAARILSGE